MDKIAHATGLTVEQVRCKIGELRGLGCGREKVKRYFVLLANSRGKRLFFVSRHGVN